MQIPRDLYQSMVRRLGHEKINTQARFLRQIPFIKPWSLKDITDFINKLRVVEFDKPGRVVLEEGTRCDKVVIVKSGQFELTKRNFNRVHMNPKSGIIQMQMSKGQIQSTEVHKKANQVFRMAEGPLYSGSELQFRIQDYLDNTVKQDVNVTDYFRSQYHQTFFKELSLGIVGQG